MHFSLLPGAVEDLSVLPLVDSLVYKKWRVNEIRYFDDVQLVGSACFSAVPKRRAFCNLKRRLFCDHKARRFAVLTFP